MTQERIPRPLPRRDREFETGDSLPSTPGGSRSQRARGVSARAGQTEQDIDKLLAESNALARRNRAAIDKDDEVLGGGVPSVTRGTGEKRGGLLPWKQDALQAEKERLEAGKGTREQREAEDWQQYQRYLKERRKRPKEDEDEKEAGENEPAEKEAEKLGDHEGFYKQDKDRGYKRSQRYKRNLRRKTGAGLIIGFVTGGSVAILTVFVPLLRLDSYLANINRRVFGYAASAMEARLGHLFEIYLVGHAIALERCGTRMNIDCRADYTDQGIASSMFRSWQDVRIEERLFDRVGVHIEYDQSATGGRLYTLRDRFGRQVRLQEQVDSGTGRRTVELVPGRETRGPRELGPVFRRFIGQQNFDEATKWRPVAQRRGVRKYLSRKHNMRLWCFFACRTRDDIELRRTNLRTRFKYFFTKRFIYPFSSKLGVIMDCLASGGGSPCSPQGLRERGIGRDVDPEFLSRIRQKVELHPNRRFFQIVLEEIVEKIFTRQAARQGARTALSFIPFVGQIYFIITVVDMFDRFDTFITSGGLTHMAADINIKQYVEWYSGMRSANDELRSHQMTLAEAGEIMKKFEGAEASLVYQALHNGTGTATQRADDDYRCPSGRRIPEGMLVCPEYTMTRTFAIADIRNNEFVDGIVDVLNGYARCYPAEIAGRCVGRRPRDIIRPVLDGINTLSEATVGALLRGAMAGIEALPVIGDFIARLREIGSDLVFGLLEKVFPFPIREDSPGREMYDGLEAGGAAVAYEFCMGGYAGADGGTQGDEPYGLGCQKLSDEQSGEIFRKYMAREEERYRQSSLATRLTDLGYQNSFANRLLAVIPSDLGEVPGRLVANFSGIFGNALSSFVSRSVGAQAQLPRDPFDIPRTGYLEGDPAFTRDPTEYTPEFCQAAQAAWEDSATEDPVSGLQTYSSTNPCLLEEGVVEAGSLFFTDD